jgi:hypothetical protein
MLLGTFQKQPADRLDYDVTYKEWLTEGDNLMSVTSSCSPDGLVIETAYVHDPMVKVWLSGGTSGTTYKITLTATTADGRIRQDEFKVKVKDI